MTTGIDIGKLPSTINKAGESMYPETNKNALDVFQESDIAALLRSDKGVQDILSLAGKVEEAFTPDTTTSGGRAAIRSTAFKFRQFKARIKDAAKASLAEPRAEIKRVNASIKAIEAALDDISNRVKAPLIQYEQEEKSFYFAREAISELYNAAMKAGTRREVIEFGKQIANLEPVLKPEDWEAYCAFREGLLSPLRDRAKVMLREVCEPPTADELVRQAILDAIVCLSAEQIVNKIMDGYVPYVRVEENG